MSWLRIKTVVRRQIYVLFRNPARWFDVLVWPLFDVILFGSLGAFAAQQTSSSKVGVPYLLAGIMLFHVVFQSQISVATGFMEETWSRNLLNLMTTPLTEAEYATGLVLYAGMKTVLALLAISLAAFAFFQFGLGEIGWSLVPIVGVLLIVGWAVAMLNIGLMLRFGQSAEIFTWGSNFLLLALSGVFNPTAALPGAARPIADILPTTYAFAASRRVLDGHAIPWGDVARGYVGAFVALGLGYWFVITMLRTFRNRGFITRFS